MDDAKKVEVMDNIAQLMALETRKVELLGQLRATLLHGWMANIFSEPKDIQEKWFLSFVTYYYAALYEERSSFVHQGKQYMVDFARHAIEWLEPIMIKTADQTSGWRGMTNPVTQRLRTIRRNYEQKIKQREERTNGS